MEDHIQQVKKAEKGRVNKIFKMKDIVAGREKAAPEAQAIKFKSKRSATYDFIVRAGLKVQLAILKLCRKLIENETYPNRLNLTTLIQIPKKGSAQELKNKRFIHIKDWLAGLVEALTVQQMKAEILQGETKFQIGRCPGMRTVFHLFVVKSKIDHSRQGCHSNPP